ncbi:MAG TPA: hypothetical protein VGH25_12040, partial [Dongiaceae bacterium]
RRHRPADQILAHRASGAAHMQLDALQDARPEFEKIAVLYEPQRDRRKVMTRGFPCSRPIF